jgi:hypothetical protein
MLRRPTLFLLLTAGLVLGASAPAPAGSSDDEAIAEDSVLTEGDASQFGLSETEPGDDPPPSGSACKKIRAARRAADRRPNAETAFGDESGNMAQSEVIVFKSERAARVPITAFSTGTAEDCLSEQLEQNLEENLDPGVSAEFSGERTEVPLGDDSVVYQIVIALTGADGSTSEVYVEFGVIRVGRAVAVLDFQGVGAPFAGSEPLASLVVDNLEANLEAS